MSKRVAPVKATLSDGTTITVRTATDLLGGNLYTEVPSRKRPGSALYRLDGRMFLLMRDRHVPIDHADYRYAATPKDGADVALRFFVEGAESCIAEAAREGLPVEAMYGVTT